MSDVEHSNDIVYRPMLPEDFRQHMSGAGAAFTRHYLQVRPGQERAWRACAEILFAASERARHRPAEDFTIAGLMVDTGLSRPTIYRYFDGIETIRNCGYDLLRTYDYEQRIAALALGTEAGFADALRRYARAGIRLTLAVLHDYRRNLALFKSRDDVFHAGHARAGQQIAALAERAGLVGPGRLDPQLFTLPSMSLALHVRHLWLEDPEADSSSARWDRAVEYYLDMQHGLLAGARMREAEVERHPGHRLAFAKALIKLGR